MFLLTTPKTRMRKKKSRYLKKWCVWEADFLGALRRGGTDQRQLQVSEMKMMGVRWLGFMDRADSRRAYAKRVHGAGRSFRMLSRAVSLMVYAGTADLRFRKK